MSIDNLKFISQKLLLNEGDIFEVNGISYIVPKDIVGLNLIIEPIYRKSKNVNKNS